MALSPRLFAVILAVTVAAMAALASAQGGDPSFNRNFAFSSWCKPPYCTRGADGSVALAVNAKSVGAFESTGIYSYGVYSVRMKLPAGYSGGIIPCLYLITPGAVSYQSIHDEIDLEFLGGTDPMNITIHTNLITGGQVKLEQFRFPFDPSAAFHTYTIVYSPDRVVWMIDNTPIRITARTPGKPFPSDNVKIMGSIWDASSWSKLKPSFARGPIVVQYSNFDVRRTCRVPPSGAVPPCKAWRSPARAPWMASPTAGQLARFRQYRQRFLVADYPWGPAK
ncbi:hypothetical protein CLOP_g25579 [Closterium sp. NIES-67]|nr:hypothetical protein CLOP_g25579 [Closterium sp. NIES-67]